MPEQPTERETKTLFFHMKTHHHNNKHTKKAKTKEIKPAGDGAQRQSVSRIRY